MSPKKRILPFLLILFVFTISLGLIILSIFGLIAILLKFEPIGLFIFFMYFSISAIFLIISISSIKWYTFNDDFSVTISYFGIFKKRWSKSDIKGYVFHRLQNKIGNYTGVIIEHVNGQQIFLNEFEFKSLEKTIAYVKENYPFHQGITEKFIKI